MQDKKQEIDSIMTFLFLKKIMTPIVKTDAFGLKLVNSVGKIIKKPETDEEKSALTILDKFIFKLRRLLGSKLSNLNQFLFLQTLNNNFYNKIILSGSIKQRAEIKRITKDIDNLTEKYDCQFDDMLYSILNESIRKKEKQNE